MSALTQKYLCVFCLSFVNLCIKINMWESNNDRELLLVTL